MNKFKDLQQAKENIKKNIFNQNFSINSNKENGFLFSNKQILFEQYKMLVDSAYKTEERRGASNNMFLGINTLLSSFIIRPSQLETIKFVDMPLFLLLILLGIFLCKEWLEVIASYKRLNSINFLLIQHFENFLPSYVFSLRTDIETQIETQNEKSNAINKANIVLIKENFLPKTFMLFYSIYAMTVIIYCIINFI